MDSNGFSRDQRDSAPLEQALALVVQVDLQANGQGVWQQSNPKTIVATQCKKDNRR